MTLLAHRQNVSAPVAPCCETHAVLARIEMVVLPSTSTQPTLERLASQTDCVWRRTLHGNRHSSLLGHWPGRTSPGSCYALPPSFRCCVAIEVTRRRMASCCWGSATVVEKASLSIISRLLLVAARQDPICLTQHT